MNSLVVILLSGEVNDQERCKAEEVLNARGFEVFAERRLATSEFSGLPAAFASGGRAIVAVNPLMRGDQRRQYATYASIEVEKAAHLLCITLRRARDRLRVTTDATQAETLARALLTAAEMKQLDAFVLGRQAEMATDLPVLADLSRFKYRAKVELVEWKGQKAVKKTFRPTAHAAMARELAFCDDIATHSEVPARVLDRTENAIFYEFIENRIRVRRFLGFRLPVPLRLSLVRELAEFVRLVTQRGWDPIDLTPRDNILVDAKTGRLRAIDFEFAHRRDAPVDPVEAWFLSGVPTGSTVARPLNNDMETDPFPGKWRPFTGLGKSSFLHDPAWLQQIKRCCVHPLWLGFHVTGALRRRRRHVAQRDALLDAVALRWSPAPHDLSV